MAHIISRQGRSLSHVVRRLFGISTHGKDPGHVKLCDRSLVFVADFTEVVESLFRIGTALCDEFLAQQAASPFAFIDARVEKVEKLK